MPLTEKQQAALISFIFNFGSGKFQASKLRQKLNRGEYLVAAPMSYQDGCVLKAVLSCKA
ncbi:glycoside hydrolase family protein [Rickettsia asiatica]|uniref:glycoside hydrolase family protein n=1 Tax=Rickettsia asiatica TaxID=238800 RepID=UPI0038CD5752